MLNFVNWTALLTITLVVGISVQTNDKPPTNQTVKGDSKNSSITALNNSRYTEGGPAGSPDPNDHTHDGREHITEKHVSRPELPKDVKSSSIIGKMQASAAVSPKPELASSGQSPSKNAQAIGNKLTGKGEQNSTSISVPTNKTALSKNNNTVLSKNVTKSTLTPQKLNVSTTPKPFKPLRTEHDDGYVAKNTEKHTQKLPNIETYIEKKTKSADYVVPIVAIIFSVPLVAFIISVVYKRGTDWWQHRNYRRMDFLIDGMYNN